MEYLHIMTDAAHVLSELTWEITFLLLGAGLSRWQAKREHRKHHEETQPKNVVPVPYSGWLDNQQPYFTGLDPDEPIPYTMPTKEDTRG